jgi:hypothetical protein
MRSLRLSDQCAPRNVPARFRPADAPLAASNRAWRRAWVAEANAVLRRTGDADAAREAGASLLVAMLDCDSRTTAMVRQCPDGLALAEINNLPRAARRRMANRDGAADRVRDEILAGERP